MTLEQAMVKVDRLLAAHRRRVETDILIDPRFTHDVDRLDDALTGFDAELVKFRSHVERTARAWLRSDDVP